MERITAAHVKTLVASIPKFIKNVKDAKDVEEDDIHKFALTKGVRIIYAR